MSTRETTRQETYRDASLWLGKMGLGDFTFAVASNAAGKRGEERVGYALGVLCALETQSLKDN